MTEIGVADEDALSETVFIHRVKSSYPELTPEQQAQLSARYQRIRRYERDVIHDLVDYDSLARQRFMVLSRETDWQLFVTDRHMIGFGLPAEQRTVLGHKQFSHPHASLTLLVASGRYKGNSSGG